MKKALIYGLSVALLLSLTACCTTQAEQPAEPEPATTSSQANEPITTPEPSETPEPEQATVPASTDTVEPQTLSQTEPAADLEPAQTMTIAPTPVPESTTKPTTTATDMTANTTPQQSQTEEPTESVEAQATGVVTDDLNKPGKVGINGVDNWDSEVYNALTPEQKAVYENASASSRSYFNAKVRQRQQHEAEGWTVQGSQLTGEELEETWSHITVGQ